MDSPAATAWSPAAPAAPAAPMAAGGSGAPWPLLQLQALQALPQADFEAALAQAVEHAPWVARRAWAARPFADVAALVQAMRAVILGASVDEQRVLLQGHPELAGSEARAGRMTAASTTEQGRLGLDRLDATTLQLLLSINQRYRERFGYPLVIALRLHADLASVLQAAQARLLHDADTELPLALQQVCEVMSGRVHRLVQARASG